MNWRAALQKKLEDISGIAVYPEDMVPKDVIFPWLTYSKARNDFSMQSASVLHLHYHTASEAVPNQKADEICRAIRDGLVISCDEGKIIMWTGSPEWQPTNDQTDMTHKHRIINVTIDWLLTR